MGRTSILAFISSPENLKRLDEFQEINRQLALGLATPTEIDAAARTASSIVWIDSGLHATEVAPRSIRPSLPTGC